MNPELSPYGTYHQVYADTSYRYPLYGTEPPIMGGVLAPWWTASEVRAWVMANAQRAREMYTTDSAWRTWLESRSGDPSLAEQIRSGIVTVQASLPIVSVSKIPTWLWIAAAIGGLWWFTKRKGR